MFRALVVALTLSLSTLPAFAGVAPVCGDIFSTDHAIFGPEFTFTNDILRNHTSPTPTSKENAAARDRLADEIMKRCAARGLKCTRTRGARKWFLGLDQIITYEDGFSVRVSTDIGSVEVQTSPATLAQFYAHREIVEHDVFDAAASIGIAPDQSSDPNWGLVGGGHVHMGVESAFLGNPVLFRNFLVDMVNHGVTKFGGRNTDPIARPIRMDDASYPLFKRVIENFDNGMYKAIPEFAEAIQTIVYAEHGEKAQAVNVSRIVGFSGEPGKQTLEFRGLDPQATFDTFLREISIFQARVAYLKSVDGLIKLNDFQMGEATGLYNYVTTAGLDWSSYADLWAARLYNPLAYEPYAITTVVPQTPATSALNVEQDSNARLKVDHSFKSLLFRAIRPN